MFLKFFKSKERPAKNPYNIDEEMFYCPECGDEYRLADNNCLKCEIPLIPGTEKLAAFKAVDAEKSNRTLELSPDDEMVPIRKGGVNDIKYIQMLLAREQIPSIIGGEEADCSKGSCGGPTLILEVRKTDVEAATELLAKDYIETTDLGSHSLEFAEAVFDQTAKETVCPACGCKFSPTVGACPECGLCFE